MLDDPIDLDRSGTTPQTDVPAAIDAAPRSGVGLAVLIAITVAVWLGLARLALAFWRVSLEWEYVAQQSRVGAPWYYRLAGVWGAMEGSLLLFTGILGVALVFAGRRAGRFERWAAAFTMLTLVVCNLVWASPFRRLDIPAVDGFGLNPILEHPAMVIHPPLLYAGLAASAGAALAAIGAVDPWPAARRWLLSTIGLLTAAMTLGGAWSYAEQGWGGYWAWDPVENTSLLVWMAGLVAVHTAARKRTATALAYCLVPWVLALLGGALVRSGRTPSVHSFAEQLEIGWALFVLAVSTATGCVVAVVRRRRRVDRDDDPNDLRRVMVLLMTIAIALVLVGTATPVVHDLFGGQRAAVGGQFFARITGPLAVAAVPFLVLQLGARRGRPRRSWRWSALAHGGFIVLLVGIGVSTFDDSTTTAIALDTTQRAAGVDVRNDGVDVGAGPRQGTEAVTANLTVDSHELRPRIDVYPDRGGRLAHVAVRTGLFTDVQVTLRSASDDGTVVVDVHRRHGMWLVWVGALLVTIATLASSTSRRSPRPGVPGPVRTLCKPDGAVGAA